MNALARHVPRNEQQSIESWHSAWPPHRLVTSAVHSSTWGAQRSGGGCVLVFFLCLPRFLPSAATELAFLASAAKGLARAATTPAPPSAKSERRRETPAVASRTMVSNDRSFTVIPPCGARYCG